MTHRLDKIEDILFESSALMLYFNLLGSYGIRWLKQYKYSANKPVGLIIVNGWMTNIEIDFNVAIPGSTMPQCRGHRSVFTIHIPGSSLLVNQRKYRCPSCEWQLSVLQSICLATIAKQMRSKLRTRDRLNQCLSQLDNVSMPT